ncbi:APA family fibronectin-binding glycoprotein, partial [Mycobacterium sp. IS-1496]|uniref:APA family fibronectin-binding glycoprotein n=1 Tax=Mycobacterium sp. IS-1496 TaxID=1772284 RepID=UPI000A4F4148
MDEPDVMPTRRRGLARTLATAAMAGATAAALAMPSVASAQPAPPPPAPEPGRVDNAAGGLSYVV